MIQVSVLMLYNDPQIRRVLQTTLVGEGFEIISARGHESVIDLIHSRRFDLVLLNLDAPGSVAVTMCREIRGISDVGIILLAAGAAERDKVEALRAGADDYVTKPFNVPELLARIHAVLRRRVVLSGLESGRIHADNLEIDFEKRRVRVGEREERLTPKEFDVLYYLAVRANQTVGHRELLRAVWGTGYGNGDRCLRDCISRLRKKIEARPNQPKYLLTVPWVGYRLYLPD